MSTRSNRLISAASAKIAGFRKKRKLNPDDCSMSLGDHLEELRARLILAILGLVVGAIVSLAFGKYILRFIEHPYKSTVRKRIENVEAPRVQAEILAFVEEYFDALGKSLAADANVPRIDPKQIEFFRKVSMDSLDAWAARMQAVSKDADLPVEWQLKVLAPADAFLAYMRIAFIAGLILTCPWVFYQLWMFVAAGLYPHERHYVRTAVPFSAGLFIIGALFFLFIIAPWSLKFFLRFGDVVGVTANWTLQKYVSFITVLMLVFGVAFQTPIAIFILVRTGLVGLPALRRARKYVLLGIVFVAAVATPPDPLSQISLAIPLYGLYELGMVLALLAEKKARESQQQSS